MSLTRCDSSRTINLKLTKRYGYLCNECGNGICVKRCFDCFSIRCKFCRGTENCCPADGGSYVNVDDEIEYIQKTGDFDWSTRKCSRCDKWYQFDDNITDLFPCVTLHCGGAICTECSEVTGDCKHCAVDKGDDTYVAELPLQASTIRKCASCDNFKFVEPMIECLTCNNKLCTDCTGIGVDRCMMCNRNTPEVTQAPPVVETTPIEVTQAPPDNLENNILEYSDIEAIDRMHAHHKAIAKKLEVAKKLEAAKKSAAAEKRAAIAKSLERLNSVNDDTFTCSMRTIERFTQVLNNIDARLGAVEMSIADIDRKVDIISETVDDYDDRLDSLAGSIASIVD